MAILKIADLTGCKDKPRDTILVREGKRDTVKFDKVGGAFKL